MTESILTIDPPIQGHCDPSFAEVHEVFRHNFHTGGETGGALAVYVDGHKVVDLWGGHANKAKTRPWTHDTLVNLASVTKAFLTAAVHRLAQDGKVDLAAPMITYWPEFGAEGKETITLEHVLGHRSGLAAIREELPPEALYDAPAMVAALERTRPWWSPGTDHGYHAMTFGWLLGEVVRRVTGRPFGRYFAEELAGPLGLDLHVGVPEALDPRVAELRGTRPDEGTRGFVQNAAADPTSLTGRAFCNPMLVVAPGIFNTVQWRRADLPFANGHGTAAAVASFYEALLSPQAPLLERPSLERCRTELSYGKDRVLGETTRFGHGFMMPHPGAPFSPNPQAFGHPGAGGHLGFADPEAKVAFGYVTGKMGLSLLIDPRAQRLVDAVYGSLQKTSGRPRDLPPPPNTKGS